MLDAEALALLPPLLSAAVVTIQLTLASVALSIVLAVIGGLARLSSKRPIRLIATALVEVFRGASTLVVVFFIFFVLPSFDIDFNPFLTGVLAIGIVNGAYGSEVVRSSIGSVDSGQWDAARALNMPHWLTMRRIILPQAVVIALPSFGNLSIEILKATPLVSVVGIRELTLQTQALRQTVSNTDDVFNVTILIYFFLAYPLAILTRRLERRAGRGLSLGRLT